MTEDTRNAAIESKDFVGDALQENALKARSAVPGSQFTESQNQAIKNQMDAGKPWVADKLERRYSAMAAQNKLDDIIGKDPRLEGMTRNQRGPDYTWKGSSLKYELLFDSRFNLQLHATHEMLRDEFFRYIMFPLK